MGTASSKPDISESPSCPTSVTSTSTPGFLDGESSASLRSPLSSISPSAPLPSSVEPEPHHTALGPYHVSEPRPSDKTRRFQCQEQGCQRLFDSRKDLRRHKDSVHDSGPRFRCRCGKLDSRKDNHDRHVRSCRPSGDGLYKHMFSCRCGVESEPSRPENHLDHVAKWNRQHSCR